MNERTTRREKVTAAFGFGFGDPHPNRRIMTRRVTDHRVVEFCARVCDRSEWMDLIRLTDSRDTYRRRTTTTDDDGVVKRGVIKRPV